MSLLLPWPCLWYRNPKTTLNLFAICAAARPLSLRLPAISRGVRPSQSRSDSVQAFPPVATLHANCTQW